MTWLQVCVLAVVQGITEFLPISSSAHLILVPQFTSWPDQGLGFDLAVHVGTLVAVITYFRAELATMMHDWGRSVVQGRSVGDSRLAWAVAFGTVPVGIAGLGMLEIEESLRKPLLIAATTVAFGLLLAFADRRPGTRSEHALTWRDVLLVGCAQALALVPGTSRSGITMTAGLLLGMSRDGAARYSFLLAVPVTLLASSLELVELASDGAATDWSAFLLGGILAAVTAFLCIRYFLKWLTRFGLLPFAVYRLLLGGLLVGAFAT